MDVGETAYRFENEKSVVLVIGVNGVGKTTSVGKLAGKLKDQAKLFSMETLRNMLELCAKTDEAIKTGKISDRVGVELLLIEFSQK